MARKSARNVMPSLSSDARDKFLAGLNWIIGKHRAGATYKLAPIYFDECAAWHDKLSEDARKPC
jgi:hypothetical protein